MEWQPIETAPKDGTDVLIWWPAWDHDRGTRYDGVYLGVEHWPAEMTVASWLAGGRHPHWVPVSGNYEDGWVDGYPTHWMPLPSPPVQS